MQIPRVSAPAILLALSFVCSLAIAQGTGTVFNNTYGPLSVSGATLVGDTISNIQPGAIVQLGSIPGAPTSYLEIDFQGFNIVSGSTFTIRSGAPGQSVFLWNVDANPTTIGGILRAEGNNGAQPPTLLLANQSGITISPAGIIVAPSGLLLSGLGNSWTVGRPVVNQGVIDGGPLLDVEGLNISGGGQFKGDAIVLSTPTSANNPVNGAHFLANGLQLYPSTGSEVSLTLHAYGTVPQVLNVIIYGNGFVWMPSSWGAASAAPSNNAVVSLGGSYPAGVAEPSYGGGSMIVQATGSLRVMSGPTNDFVFPGAIALRCVGDLDLNGVVINQGWTTTGKQFQGLFFESPRIISPGGTIQVLTNNPNWINFSTWPLQHVSAFSLVPNAGGGASFIASDAVSTHVNSYSQTIEAAANGQCWTCLINSTPMDMR